MSVLQQYDEAMAYAHRMRVKGNELLKAAHQLEEDTYREFGIKYVSRDPGFDCWTHDDLSDYYQTPRDVVKSLDCLRSTQLRCGPLPPTEGNISQVGEHG